MRTKKVEEKTTFNVSYRCFYESDDGPKWTQHYRNMPITDIPKWIEAYRFTHPDCLSVSLKVWFTDPPDYEYGREM